MLVPFSDLHLQSKIWIYQSNKAFTNSQIAEITTIIEAFLTQWRGHGKDLKASYKISYNQFIILAVDEQSEFSGCAIDESVHLIQKIEVRFQVVLTNKLQIAHKVGDAIQVVSLADFKEQIATSNISPETIVFNNMVTTVAALKTEWEVPAKQSWLNKYFR